MLQQQNNKKLSSNEENHCIEFSYSSEDNLIGSNLIGSKIWKEIS